MNFVKLLSSILIVAFLIWFVLFWAWICNYYTVVGVIILIIILVSVVYSIL